LQQQPCLGSRWKPQGLQMNHLISTGPSFPYQTSPAYVFLLFIQFISKALPLHQSTYLLAELYNFEVLASLSNSLKHFIKLISIIDVSFLF
jgi:hypothetical protein